MKTNSLVHTVSKTASGEFIRVKIRLNDCCKNGHQDFSITADLYEANKPATDKYMIGSGCMHDDILKHFPEFKIFIDLHLCDYAGIPTYAVENGFYHLREGFNNTKPTSKDFKKEFCNYYRMNSKQFDAINESENKLEFAILLKELGILNQWSKQAQKAIKELEKLTGDEFLNDSTKSQYNEPKAEDIVNFTKQKKAGFYSLENKRKRAKEARRAEKCKKIQDIKNDCLKATNKANQEKTVKLWLISYLERLSKKRGFNIDFNFDNYIYYDHTTELKFNWLDYKKTISENEFKIFCDNLKDKDFNKLPQNISFSIEGCKTFTNK